MRITCPLSHSGTSICWRSLGAMCQRYRRQQNAAPANVELTVWWERDSWAVGFCCDKLCRGKYRGRLPIPDSRRQELLPRSWSNLSSEGWVGGSHRQGSGKAEEGQCTSTQCAWRPGMQRVELWGPRNYVLAGASSSKEGWAGSSSGGGVLGCKEVPWLCYEGSREPWTALSLGLGWYPCFKSLTLATLCGGWLGSFINNFWNQSVSLFFPPYNSSLNLIS